MVVQVVVYSEVASGANVVNVVNDVPDWLTTPELVTTEPSELVVVQVVVYSEAWSLGKVVMVVREEPN